MIKNHKKLDAHEFLAFLDKLKQEVWLDEQRKWWPDYLFHFTNILNADSILNRGYLFSRAEAERQRIDFASSASSQVISRTAPAVKDSVRLYFRPGTPTTYHMEGFKPRTNRYEDAHCPVPIYFLFDMKEIITLHDTRFSNGNLASEQSNIFASADEFAQLPFEDIYHDTRFSPEDKCRIKNARQAEVIYPKIISLDYLKYICCRSQAEYETLQNLLPPAVWKQQQAKVVVNKKEKLFSKEWLYIEDVTLTNRSIAVDFHLPIKREDYGPFKIRVDMYNQLTNDSYYFKQEYSNIVSELTNARLDLNLPSINIHTVRVSIDDKLAYSRRV